MRINALLLTQVALSAAQLVPFTMNVGLDGPDHNLVVSVPCAECGGDGNLDLVVNFNIPSDKPNKLFINDEQVLPLSPENVPTALRTSLVEHNTEAISFTAVDWVNLEYTLMITQSMSDADLQHKTDTFELRIYSANGKPVNVDGLVVEVTEDLRDGALFISGAYQTPNKPPCTTVKCLINSMIEKVAAPVKNFRHRKPCHGKGRKQHHNAVAEALEGWDMGHTGERHGHSHGGYPEAKQRHHHHRESFFNMVFVPLIAGVGWSLCAFIFGIILGHVIRMTVRKIRGASGGVCPHRRRRNQDVEEGSKEDEATQALLPEEQGEAPPAYKDETAVEAVEKE